MMSMQSTKMKSITPSRLRRVAGVVAVLAALGVAGSAHAAEFGIQSFDGEVTNSDNTVFTQAGGHPHAASTTIDFNLNPDDPMVPVDDVKHIVIDLPPGFAGNPAALPKCEIAQVDVGQGCPTDTQVGTILIVGGLIATGPIAVFNMVPPRGMPAMFSFTYSSVIVNLEPRVRTESDYGLTLTSSDIPQMVPIVRVVGTFSGVTPDGQRAFLTNPVTCTPPGVGLETKLSIDSWKNPGVFDHASFFSHLSAPDQLVQQGPDGCDRVPFEPSIDIAPTTRVADAPTGLNVDLTFPQGGLLNPDGIATAHLKKATVTLPEGMSVNPSAANGLAACADAQLKLRSVDAVSCPDGAKVGTVTARSPLLDESLSGGIFIRSQNSGDPESGEMFRIALVLENKERGLSVRLPGSIRADAHTGQLVTTFDNNPQLPVSDISLHFNSGPRAPLATPPTCGQKEIVSELTSWIGQTVTRRSTFTIDCAPGLGAFAPSFTAGTIDPKAGSYSPFTLKIGRPDGQSALDGLTLKLPQGLLANLRGNLGKQVGTVHAAAGPGETPYWLPGMVVLEGPYGDAPYSLRATVPAKAGPFDLGEVVVRQKIYVDPITAVVTVVSDPLPTIVKGVPVRLQTLAVDVDKPGFTLNPTSCDPKQVDGALHAASGQTAAVTKPFQVSGCPDLELTPDIGLTFSGKGQTTDNKHPAVSADVTQQPGQANLKKVRVALPLSVALDPDNANGLCEFVDGSKVEPTCPKASIVGTATATTPILDQPLTGPVYFVKNIRIDKKTGRQIKTLPKLVIPLVGENGLRLTLTGTSDVADNRLVTTFDNIPDAPVSSFKLNIIGGKGGILVVSGTDICKASQVADQQIDGQNGKTADADVYIQTPSCPLKVISKKVGKSSVAVKVGGLGAGKVTVTGRGIKKTTKTISKSTVATITAKRSKAKPGKVTVSFDPTGPAKARKTTK
jgi:hypothetical protein